jgi:transcription factor E2F3
MTSPGVILHILSIFIKQNISMLIILGIGLVTKKTKNHFQWVGGDVDPDNQIEPDEVELNRLREREKELTSAIDQQETQLRYLTDHNDKLGYVTCKDLRSIFRNHLVLCIKAPPDTKLQVPEPTEGFQMLLKSTRGPIDCYLCPETEENESENETTHNYQASRNGFTFLK